jgi:hypothetical protein
VKYKAGAGQLRDDQRAAGMLERLIIFLRSRADSMEHKLSYFTRWNVGQARNVWASIYFFLRSRVIAWNTGWAVHALERGPGRRECLGVYLFFAFGADSVEPTKLGWYRAGAWARPPRIVGRSGIFFAFEGPG